MQNVDATCFISFKKKKLITGLVLKAWTHRFSPNHHPLRGNPVGAELFFLTDLLQISALPPSRTAPVCPIQRSPRSKNRQVSQSVKGLAPLAIARGGVASAKAATVKMTVEGA